jgi:hypothetical protein
MIFDEVTVITRPAEDTAGQFIQNLCCIHLEILAVPAQEGAGVGHAAKGWIIVLFQQMQLCHRDAGLVRSVEQAQAA